MTEVVPESPQSTSARRMNFLKAFKAEIKHWKRLSQEEESLLIAFCACVAMRMRGEDPETLLPK
jgi:hypothetical protein